MKTFRTDRLILVIGVLMAAGAAIAGPASRFWVLCFLFLIGPGYLLERVASFKLPLLVRPAVWIGVSMALIPLLYAWLSVGNLAVRPWLIWAIAIGIGIGIVWVRWFAEPPHLPQGEGLSINLLLLCGLVVGLTIWNRSAHIRDIVAPPWVDSVHHAVIIKAMALSGQVPISLRPLMPVDQFIYHWGYHSIGAAFQTASGLSLITTMLWLGQLLGVLQVIAFGGAATLLWRRPLAFIVAGSVVGLASILPAYFLSWGRYTLLAGTLLLPAVIVLAWIQMERTDRRAAWLVALVISGATMIHIMTATLAVLWCGATWLIRAIDSQQKLRSFQTFLLSAGVTLLLSAPWIARMLQKAAVVTKGPNRLTGSDYNTPDKALPLLWMSDNRELLGLAALGIVFMLWRRWRGGTTLVAWIFAVLLVANPVWIGLPYISFFSNNIVVLAVFVPITLAISGGVVACDEWLTALFWRRHNASTTPMSIRYWRMIRAFGLAVFMLLSTLNSMNIVNGDLILFKTSDRPAMEWIAANTPPNARFAINSTAWLATISRGTDGGWWILPLTGREVSTPPVIFHYGTQEYINVVLDQTQWLRETTNPAPEAVATWMRQYQYQYAYATPNGQQFNSQQLATSPLFVERYHSDEVSIFELVEVPPSP